MTYGADGIYNSDLFQNAWDLATLTLISVCMITAVWAITGVWRSSTNYHRSGGKATLSVAAKVCVAVAALGFAAQSSRVAPPAIETALLHIGIDRLGEPAALSVDGTNLEINGLITDKVSERFKSLIDRHPEIKRISLTSLGGRSEAALQISSIISRRNLETVAVGECSSACTIIFLAGKTRALDVNSVLGFHGPRVLGMSDLEVRYSSQEVVEAYQAAGLSEAFINHALDTPPSKMWFPSDDILVETGAINLFTKAYVKQNHDEAVEQFKKEAPLKIDESMSVVSAKRDDINITYTYVIAAREDEIDWASMSKRSERDANALICGDAVSNLMVNSGATYSYLYVDKIGKKVGIATVDNCSRKQPYSNSVKE